MLFDKEKKLKELLVRYKYLKSVEESDRKQLEEINEIKKRFREGDANTICHVPLNGDLDFVKRNFDNDYKESEVIVGSHMSKIRNVLKSETEFQNFRYLIRNKIDIKINLIAPPLEDIGKLEENLDYINESINVICEKYSGEDSLLIKNEIIIINDLIDKMVCDKMASQETSKLIDDEIEIIKRNIERKKIEDKLKRKNINIYNNPEENGNPFKI